LAQGGKVWWQQQSSTIAQPARPIKAGSASDDPLPSAAAVKVYGVLGQPEEAANGGYANPAPVGGSPSLEHSKVDRANAAVITSPYHFLHKRLLVKTFQFCEFELPSHALRPELEWTFQSVAAQGNPDGDASVEVSLMNAGEFARFLNHRPVVAQLTSAPSNGGEIYWTLKSPPDKPQKYYLVFRNSSTGQGPSVVDADFTASFE
jgi:hypothetical protein